MPARTFAIGDIHGCDVALETLLAEIAPTSEDRVVILGDVVDRGPNTRRAIDLLLSLQGRCELILLLGNHEEMMLEAFRSRDVFRNWLAVGGREALDSYEMELRNVPAEHREFLATGVNYFTTPTEIFVHANLEPGIPVERQGILWLRWQHLTGMEFPHESGRRVICGHTQQKSGRPFVRNGWVCLDTGAYRGNPLTCLHVETNQCLQATQSGQLLPTRDLAEIAVQS